MVYRFEQFSFMISEISHYWHKIASEEMEKHSLKGTHSIYLMAMYRYPEGITAPKLCEVCGRDKADVSRMMSIMEKKGLVVKEGRNQNLYKGIFMLTEKGKEAAEHVRERAALAVELAGKDIDEEKRVILYEALEAILDNLRELSKTGLPSS